MIALPPLATWEQVCERLPEIFPEGTANRGYCIRDISCKTIFVLLYIGAVEGTDRWLAPKHVYRMSDRQASRTDDQSRINYEKSCRASGYKPPGAAWYADTSREPIRDETLKDALVPLGAVVTRKGLPTTSSKGRYALQATFSQLFDPALDDDELKTAIQQWQSDNLSASALARVHILRQGVVARTEGVMVTFPNGETRKMAAGPSSVISKAVIEEFAPRFLADPGVIFLSESRQHVVTRDDDLARALGLNIQADKHLPDLILVDLGRTQPLLAFVEIVATDGPITEVRRMALEALVIEAGFPKEYVAFVTAFSDRSAPPFRKAMSTLAWSSFAWFTSEPDNIVQLHQSSGKNVSTRIIDLILAKPKT